MPPPPNGCGITRSCIYNGSAWHTLPPQQAARLRARKQNVTSSRGTTWSPSWSEPVLCDTGGACAQTLAQMRYLHGDITEQQLTDVYQAQATGALIGLGADALFVAGRPLVRYAVAHPRKAAMVVCVALNIGCGPERAGELAEQMRAVNKMFNEGKIEQAARVLRTALTK